MSPALPIVLSLATEALSARRDFAPLRRGIEISVVYRDPVTQSSAAVLRYAAGASVPLHRHVGHEHILVLEGSQADERGTYDSGTFVINPPGTSHSVWSSGGCTVLLIWEKPIEFVDPADEVGGKEPNDMDSSLGRDPDETLGRR